MNKFFAFLLVLGTCLVPSWGQEGEGGSTGSMVQDLAPGGRVKMDLSAGEYVIRGSSPDGKIHLRWKAEDDARVRIHMDAKGGDARIHTDGPRNHFRVEIDLPPRIDMKVRLSVGELSIKGIEGNKDIRCRVGDLLIEVGDEKEYRQVEASVKIGDIQGFGRGHSGFFRSLDFTGSGTYDLIARLGIGDIRFPRAK